MTYELFLFHHIQPHIRNILYELCFRLYTVYRKRNNSYAKYRYLRTSQHRNHIFYEQYHCPRIYLRKRCILNVLYLHRYIRLHRPSIYYGQFPYRYIAHFMLKLSLLRKRRILYANPQLRQHIHHRISHKPYE